MQTVLKYRKLSPRAFTPRRVYKGSAGIDIRAAHGTVIKARSQGFVHTDLAIKLPRGTYGQIASRSGLALKEGVIVGGGIVDDGYEGEVGVILFNLSPVDVLISAGDACAQLLCQRIELPEPVEDKNLYVLNEEDGCWGWFWEMLGFNDQKEARRGRGYGSSGK